MDHHFASDLLGVYALTRRELPADGLIENCYRLVIHVRDGQVGARVLTAPLGTDRLTRAIDGGFAVYSCTFDVNAPTLCSAVKLYTAAQVRANVDLRDPDRRVPLSTREDLRRAASRAIAAFMATRRAVTASGACRRCGGNRVMTRFAHVHGGVCYACGGTGRA